MPRSASTILSAVALTAAVSIAPALATTPDYSSTPPTANSDSPVTVTRLAGADRYATAAEVSEQWSSTTDRVYVVSGHHFPDALVAAARAGVSDSPVLLAKSDHLPSETVAALERLQPNRIVVIGGTASVSDTVMSILDQHAGFEGVERIVGDDRYSTSARVATQYSAGRERTFLASGEDYPDALSAAAVAGSEHEPLLLTQAGNLPNEVAAQLQRLAPEEIVVVGGPSAVSNSVAAEAATYSTSGTFQRVAGGDRYKTSAAVAKEFSTGVTPGYVASGVDYADALVVSALAARDEVPAILTPASRVAEGTQQALDHLKPDHIYVAGGPAAVSDDVVSELAAPEPTPPAPAPPPETSLGSSGALPVGEASYVIPAGSVFVATNGSDSNSGTESAPVKTVSEAIGRSSQGSTIVIRGGTYHQRFSVTKAVTIQNYPGEAVWFDGSTEVSGFTGDGGDWRKDGWTAEFDDSASFTRGSDAGGFVSPDYPMASHPDQVWIDGVAQRQVGSRSAVEPGTFYVDYATDRLYIGSDPAGATTRASTIGRAIEVRAEGSTLRGFGVRRYAPSVPDMGTVIVERPNVAIDNLHLIDNSTVGISFLSADISARHLTVQRNGLLGIHANHSDGLDMEQILSTGNNSEHFNQAPVSGGIKVTRARDISLDRATLTDNNGPGYWLDESVKGGQVSNSIMHSNLGHGMSLEISAEMLVAGNVIRDNGRFGIKINNTSDVELWNNTIVGNDRPVNIVQDNRRGSDLSTPGHDPRYPGALTWINGPVTVHNSVLSAELGNCLLCVEDYSKEFTAEEFDVTANNNVYQRDTATAPQWVAIWSRGAANPSVFTTLPAFRDGTGQESTSLELLGTEAVDAEGRVTAAVTDAAPTTATALPESVADLMDLPAVAKVLGAPLE